MEVSGQHHAPAALPPGGGGNPLPIKQETGCTSITVWTFWRKRKIRCPYPNSNHGPSRQLPSRYIDYAIPDPIRDLYTTFIHYKKRRDSVRGGNQWPYFNWILNTPRHFLLVFSVQAWGACIHTIMYPRFSFSSESPKTIYHAFHHFCSSD